MPYPTVEPAAMSRQEGQGPLVLLVDDDAENRRLLREFLEVEGLSVIGEAADGAAAVQITLEVGADVVLMDLRMPVMGGIEATRRIKEASAHTQVIVLTSDQSPQSERSAAEAGAYAYLVKDCGPGVVVDAVIDAWKHHCGLDQPQSVEAGPFSAGAVDRGH